MAWEAPGLGSQNRGTTTSRNRLVPLHLKDGHATSSKEQLGPLHGAHCAPVAVHSSCRIAMRQSATHFAVIATRDDAAAAIAVPVMPAPAHVSELLTGEGFGLCGAGERRGRRTRLRRGKGQRGDERNAKRAIADRGLHGASSWRTRSAQRSPLRDAA